MRKVLSVLIFCLLMVSCSSTKSNMRYFDTDNKEVSKSEFRKLRSYKYLTIQGDSINHQKLVLRENHGELDDFSAFKKTLKSELNLEIDPEKPLIIIYHPGKDPCNSSGTATPEDRKLWHEEVEKVIYEIAETKPIYIYKNPEGTKEANYAAEWHKDPNNIIENTFFDHHYPCSSFVVISKNGYYYSYFGEFAKEYIWEATHLMNKMK